jgi:autotransporter translocation and assembly factor TamB
MAGSALRWGSRAVLALAVGVAVTGGACLAVVLALSLGWQRAWLTREIESRASQELGTPVSLGALEGHLHRRVVVRDLRIGPADDPQLEVRELSLRWDLPRIVWSRNFVADSVRAVGARAVFTRDQDGSWTWAGTGAKAGGDAEPEVEPPAAVPWFSGLRVRSLALEDARLALRWGPPESRSQVAAALDGEGREWRLPLGSRQGRAPELQLDGRLEPSTVGRARLEGGELHLGLDEAGEVALRAAAQGSFGALQVEGGGHVPTPQEEGEPALHLKLALSQLDLGALAAEPALASRLEGQAVAEFSLPRSLAAGPERLRFRVDLGPSRLAIGALHSARLRGELAGPHWRIEEGVIDAQGVEIAVTGAGTRRALEELAVDARVPDLAQLEPWLGAEAAARGSLSARARLQGELPLPDGRLALSGSDLALRGLRLGELTAAIESHGERVQIESLALEGGDLPLSVEPGAAFRVAEGGVSSEGITVRVGSQSLRVAGFASAREVRDLRLRFDAVDLGALSAPFAPAGRGPGGVLDGSLRFDGALPLPRGRADLSWEAPAWRDLRAERLKLHLVSDDRSVRGRLEGAGGVLGASLVATASLPVPAEPADGSAWLSQSGARVELRARALELASLGPFLPEALDQPSGTADLALTAQGSWSAPRVEGRLEIAEAGVRVVPLGRRFAPIRGSLAWSGEQLRVEELSVGPEGARARVSGSIRVPDLRDPAQHDADLQVALTDFPVGEIAPDRSQSGGLAPPEGGRIDADLRVRGDLRAPAVDGSVLWKEPRWAELVFDSLAVDLAVRDGSVEASGRLRYAGRQVLTGDAQLPVSSAGGAARWLRDPDTRIELRGDDLELALLEPFLPRLVEKPRGRAQLQLVARGGSGGPQVEGSLRLADGALRVPLLGRTFSPVSGEIQLVRDALRVQELRIGEPGQQARLHGRVALEALRPTELDLELAFEQFPLSRSAALRTDVDGSLSLTGSAQAPRLAGELTLRDAALSLGREVDTALKEIRIVTRENGGAASALREQRPGQPDALDRATLDVAFVVPRGSWIHGEGLNFEVSGRARAAKGAREPVRWTGQARVVRGTYEMQGRRFQVRRGEVELTGGAELDPILDVEAAYPVSQVTVVAHLSGRVSSPELKLTSEPAMSESDVISYLVFGRPASELGASEQQGVDQTALSLVAGMAASELREVLGEELPFDTLDIRLEEGGRAGELGVGKYVTRDVFVRYGHRLGEEATNQVQLEWRLDENWSVQSNISDRGDAGADLIFNIDY